jgi:hypothetical protein
VFLLQYKAEVFISGPWSSLYKTEVLREVGHPCFTRSVCMYSQRDLHMFGLKLLHWDWGFLTKTGGVFFGPQYVLISGQECSPLDWGAACYISLSDSLNISFRTGTNISTDI